MKIKYFIGAVCVIAIGGAIVCRILGQKNDNDTTIKMDEKCNGNRMSYDDTCTDKEKKCNETVYQVHESMNDRNTEAKEILNTIHDDMKKSEENISSKKEDIERMMKNLRK